MTPHRPLQAIPAAVDQYRLLRPLGSGGAGFVYAANDTLLARRVAIKLTAHKPSTAARAQFLREARLAGAVRHPHVVSTFGAGAFGGGIYLVMEIIEGQSVQSLLDARPLSWRKATAILIGACEGVMAAHACGIIHRDVKPANLLLGADGAVKLIDFGLARRLQNSMKPVTAGTPHYMSPEQCRGEKDDERTDIYSLGATYYTLLVRRTPYVGATPLQIMFEHCSAPAPDPCRINRKIPRTCAAVVMRAMAKRRADRFESVRALRDALEGLLRRSKAWRI